MAYEKVAHEPPIVDAGHAREHPDPQRSPSIVPQSGGAPARETIREGLRVVFGIGARLESALSDYESLREAADAARERRGADELEIVEGEARLQIARAVWEDGLPFGQAVDRFGSRG